ncbi:glycosyltransferase family 2 protein [Methylotetracoccus oryzae]|uniref:glycosyltransferase family 2 protein n=1 Tax=Methylotetracoccus oryzae TaxID=1919059 RepID=UPI00111989A1|nr:glycosyltransferase family A protein [Methylotetracoccus oryzae]
MQRKPLISAILTTFNRAGYLPRVLEALAAQTLDQGQFEVVVVDDGSSDQTHAVIEGYRHIIPGLRYAFQRNSGLAAAKNHGIFLARAPIVLFLDDDDAADPRLLEEHLICHRTNPSLHHAVLGFTDMTPEIASDPLMDFVTGPGGYLFSYSDLREGDELSYRYFWGGRSSAKRELFVRHGLFDPVFRFGCEDIELGFRLSAFRLKVIYHPKARTSMMRSLSLADFLRRCRLQGESQYVFSQKHLVPEILEYTNVLNSEAQWQRLEPLADSIFRSALALDTFVRTTKTQDLQIGEHVIQALSWAYHRAFQAANYQGIVGKLRQQFASI